MRDSPCGRRALFFHLKRGTEGSRRREQRPSHVREEEYTKKTTCRFPALPYMHLFRGTVILGIWGISSLDLILSCSTHNFSWWLMQGRGRCYCLDPRQPEHFWRDSSKYTTYSENATEFTGQRWHRLQFCDGKIRLKDKNESLGFSS